MRPECRVRRFRLHDGGSASRPVTADHVLDEFGRWLKKQPPSPAKWWVMQNMPSRGYAHRALAGKFRSCPDE